MPSPQRPKTDWLKIGLVWAALYVGGSAVIVAVKFARGDRPTESASESKAQPARRAESRPPQQASPASASAAADRFDGRADLAVAVAMLDTKRGQRVRGVVDVAAGPDRAPLRATALYLAQPQRLDLSLRYPASGDPGRASGLQLDLYIPRYAGVGSYPIRTHKGGVDASAFARQAVLHVFAPDTGITGLSGIQGTQEIFANGYQWLRDGRVQTFDDIGGAIHVLEVGNGRLLAEISAVLYASSHVAPGFAGYGEREGRASVSGRVEFATLNEVPR